MRYPKFIKPNDNICFIAPSFGATTYPYNCRVKWSKRFFEKNGYNVIIGDNVNKAELPYLSNAPELIGCEFMEMYKNPNVSLLLSVGGGEMQFETLPYIDFEEIKNLEPKWFNGFSDNTNYSFLLTTISDVASIYGHCAGSFGMRNLDQSILDDFNIMRGENLTLKGYPKFQLKSSAYQKTHPLSGYNLKMDKVITSIFNNEEHFEGRMLGGCLDILSLICGTKFDKVKEFNEKYSSDGVVWFLEACDLNLLSFIRSIWQLEHAGWFKHCKGIILGRPIHSEDCFDISLEKHSVSKNRITVMNGIAISRMEKILPFSFFIV
jgi:muramoyltetrapeptide carboxypeptidase LdcA involved in peptidoglycan recycling